ncbi:MAG: AbrB/MazE/SpoVT family DNA-binding domain-containing protein [Acidobacteria bacterium]|jgi:AbrB family looped-hinge helix DNA binding protein|nr:AbrB/MazE/SpoVT family DNA-binding domain-containing protein [Acidobacteriota bacterium]
MITKITLDRAGRVVLPKPIRDELQIAPGDSLELESSADGLILRPARGNGRLRKKRGAWVFDSGTPLREEVVQDTLQRVREERGRKGFRRNG